MTGFSDNIILIRKSTEDGECWTQKIQNKIKQNDLLPDWRLNPDLIE